MPTSRTSDCDSQVIRRKIAVPPPPERLVVRERIDRLLGNLIEDHPLDGYALPRARGRPRRSPKRCRN